MSKMKQPVTNHPKKWVECLDCCWVGEITKFIPLRLSCCGNCGSLKIRLYKVKVRKWPSGVL